MKKYLNEIIILLIQTFMFYIFPLFTGPTDVMGMVLVILLSSFATALILGCSSDKKIKLVYPVIVAILFIPSIFIYYNESALVHSLWHFVSAVIGMAIGFVIRKIFA